MLPDHEIEMYMPAPNVNQILLYHIGDFLSNPR